MVRAVVLLPAACLGWSRLGGRGLRWRVSSSSLGMGADDEGDGFASSSDAFDVMDDEGWVAEGEEMDAAVTIRPGWDCAEEPIDTVSYFFGNEDDDAELRRLLGELETQFSGKDDAASRSILDSVRSCGSVLQDEEASTDFELDARAALAFAATARGESPGDEVEDDAGDLVAIDMELAEAYAVLDGEALDPHLDNMYSWMLANASAAASAKRDAPGRAEGFGGMGVSIGLDLGTTNSAAAVVDASGQPRLLGPLVPSVVCFVGGDDDDRAMEKVGRIALRDDAGAGVVAVVGHDAEALRGHGVHGQSVCSRVKRILARDATLRERRRVGALEEETRRHGHVVTLKVPALPRRVSAAEVSAEVVRKLREDAVEALGSTQWNSPLARRAVVGVPARFDDAAKEATVTAAKLGGFEAVHLITEPEAAALAYGASRQRVDDEAPQVVLVFDLGGGTFDASVVELAASSARLVSLGGDAKLGGDDFDAALAEHLGDRFFDDHGIAVTAPTARLRLLAEAERVKNALSANPSVAASARGLARVDEKTGARARGGKPLDLDAPVSRRLFEALCRPLLDRLEATTRDVCAAADVALEGGQGAGGETAASSRRLDGVLLVGGATRIPAVGRLLRKLTGLPLSKIIAASDDVHPDEAVALGCAIRAAALDVEASLAPVGSKQPDFHFVS